MRLCLLTVLVACHGDARVGVDAATGDPRTVVAQVGVGTPNRALDVLFLVDDSASTVWYQGHAAEAMHSFVAELATAPGGMPDLHVGVVSSDMGTSNASGPPAPDVGSGAHSCSGSGKNGMLQSGQATNVADGYLADNGAGIANYTGDSLTTTLGQMMQVGSDGCGFAQDLAATVASFDGRNTGFVRSAANLIVLIIGDEDDCSAHDASLFAPTSNALGQLGSFRCTQFGVTCTDGGATSTEIAKLGAKSDCAGSTAGTVVEPLATFRVALARAMFVDAIVGPVAPFGIGLDTSALPMLTPSCTFTDTSGTVVADPAVRLTESAGVASNICTQDLTDPLARFGQRGAVAAGSACAMRAVPSPASCVAEDVVAGSVVATLPSCDSAADGSACFSLVPDPVHCLLDDHLALTVTRAEPASDPGVVTRLRCNP